jgi:hypothetical protein
MQSKSPTWPLWYACEHLVKSHRILIRLVHEALYWMQVVKPLIRAYAKTGAEQVPQFTERVAYFNLRKRRKTLGLLVWRRMPLDHTDSPASSEPAGIVHLAASVA